MLATLGLTTLSFPDNNNFIINNSSMVVNIVWETGGKTVRNH